MNKSNHSFYSQSPHKILQKAQLYCTNLNFHHELPKKHAKSIYVHEQAKKTHEFIDFTIKKSAYQQQLFRKKEEEDRQTRNKFEQKIKASIQQATKNQKEISAKKGKDAQKYCKNLMDIYQKHQQQEKKHRSHQKEQAYKLRTELIQFHKNGEEKKRNKHLQQINVSSCYKNALDRLQNIHKKNQQYSVNVELRLRMNLHRNDNFNDNIRQKRTSLSTINTSKQAVLNKSMTIFNDRQNHFIQKYLNNEENSLSARKYIDAHLSKTKKRLGDFFKTRIQKWRDSKERVDSTKSQIPKKCLQLLNKTSQSFFKNTITNFNSNAQNWHSIVSENKILIKQKDEKSNDKIMNNHLDIRLRNNSSSRITQKMQSMRQQARKLTQQYL